MSDWNLPPRPKIRIGRVTAGFMISVAFGFDGLQLVPKVFYLLASAGGLLVGWIPFIGQATALGMVGAAMVIDYVFSIIIFICGYMTMWLWFHLQGIALWRADRMLTRRLQVLIICILIECIPFINIVPTLTAFTIANLLLARKMDRELLAEWQKKFERFAEAVRRTGLRDQRTRAFLHAVQKGEVSHDRFTREAKVWRQKMARRQADQLENESLSQRNIVVQGHGTQ